MISKYYIRPIRKHGVTGLIKDHLSTATLVVGLALSFISFNQWFSAPAVDLSASVETSIYKSHPSIQSYIDEELNSTLEIEEDLRKIGGVKAQGLTGSQISLVANLLREQSLNTKHSFNFDARTFLVYKIDNSGNKAATNVALVNSLSGVALVDGTNKSVRVGGKEPVELGEIPPRSTKMVYFWTSDYYYSRGDNSFVKYSDGTVDVDAMVPLGGIYKHFHDFSFMYQLLIFAVAVSLLIVFVVDKFVSKNPAVLELEQGRKPKRRRRRSRPKSRPDSQTRD